MDGLKTFQASSPLAFSLPTRPDWTNASRASPFHCRHQCAVNAVLAGTCKLYLAPRPIAPTSIAATAENTFNGRTSICAVRCGGLAPRLGLVAFLLTPRVIQITHARHKTRGEPLETMQMCGATVICTSMRSIISLRHFAPACMHEFFWAIQTVGSPATRGTEFER